MARRWPTVLADVASRSVAASLSAVSRIASTTALRCTGRRHGATAGARGVEPIDGPNPLTYCPTRAGLYGGERGADAQVDSVLRRAHASSSPA